MSRAPTQTAEEALAACIRQCGRRANAEVTSENRTAVRKWLVAEGIPSAYVQTLSLSRLAGVYKDETNGTLAALRSMSRSFADKPTADEENNQDTDDMDTQIDIEEVAPPLQPERNAKQNGHANGQLRKADTSDAARKLAEALGAFASLNNNPVDAEEVRRIVNAEIKKALENGPVLKIEIRRDGELVGRVEGRTHPKFATILKAAAARDTSGYAPNIWIAGPAGSGKTRAAHDVARALNLGFEHNGALSMPHELTGFIDAAGKYHSTAFRRAYETGAVYLFDEVDASDNAALLALNAALANGHAAFPDMPIPRHLENRILVAANTWGMGATSEFVGRAKIDAAFLDRFPVKVFFDYDEKLEREICGNPDWAITVQKARARAKARGLKVAITPRASIGGAALLAVGFSEAETADLTYLANLSPDQRRQIGG